MRRVVLTGLGCVTPYGIGAETFWRGLESAHCPIRRIEEFDTSRVPSKIAGRVPDSFEECLPRTWRSLPRFSQFALVASREALVQSGLVRIHEVDDRLELQLVSPESVGVNIGCGIGSIDDITSTYELVMRDKYRRITPFSIPRMLTNMPAAHVSMEFGLRGGLDCHSTACASGAQSIVSSYLWIRAGLAKAVVAGGTESCINETAVAGFSRARALATGFNHEPSRSSRPFTVGRDGFVMSEGCGVVILEDMDHALSRGAHILGELVGVGVSADAFHLTSPRPDGDATFRCMLQVVDQMKIRSSEIHYINAHATSTSQGDAAEARAISRLFLGDGLKGKDSCHTTFVSSIKGHIGHTLGASGSLEAIVLAQVLQHRRIPTTLHLTPETVDVECLFDSSLPLQHVWSMEGTGSLPLNDLLSKNEPLHVLSNSSGFGGVNCCIGMKSFIP